MNSRWAGMSEATTGVPDASASIGPRPNPSNRLGNTATLAVRYACSTVGSSAPVSTEARRPSSVPKRRRRPSSGPRPIRRTCTPIADQGSRAQHRFLILVDLEPRNGEQDRRQIARAGAESEPRRVVAIGDWCPTHPEPLVHEAGGELTRRPELVGPRRDESEPAVVPCPLPIAADHPWEPKKPPSYPPDRIGLSNRRPLGWKIPEIQDERRPRRLSVSPGWLGHAPAHG